MKKEKLGIDAHLYIYHCDCEDCEAHGDSIEEDEMRKIMDDLMDWLMERGLVYSGSFGPIDMNEEDEE